MKKNLYQVLRDGLVSIDETLPEIRGSWKIARDAVWAYTKFTAVAAVLIIGAGAWLGVYAMLTPARAATYTYTGLDMQSGKSRMCGRADPVLDVDLAHVPGEPGSPYAWLDHWRVTTCDGHNPATSCPAGLIQWHHMRSGGSTTYRDYVCADLSVPPQPLDQPRIRPCYGPGGQPCWGVVEFWQGDWYGTWHPDHLAMPGFCPPWLGVVSKNVSYGHPPGVGRVTCGPP